MKYTLKILLTFSFNLSAQTQVVMEEVMNMKAPYVGEFTTTTTKYAAKDFFREESSIEIDRFLIRVAMGGNKVVGTILNGKTETRVVYNSDDEEFASESFDTIRSNEGRPKLNAMNRMMNMGGGSRSREDDEDDEEDEGASNTDSQRSNNEYSRTISESLENISGFNARKVSTRFKRGDEGMMVIEEWFTEDTTLFQYFTDVESSLVDSYGGVRRNNPRSFSESMLSQSEQEFESVPGRMVKYTMEMKDEDNGFSMAWELKSIKEMSFDQSNFEVFKKYKKVDELD